MILQYSVKTNNLSLFHKSNSGVADLFFAFDGPNYSRYLVWLDIFLTNTDEIHAPELLLKDGILVAHSLLPGALSAVDKTMEETVMTITQEGKKQTREMTHFFIYFLNSNCLRYSFLYLKIIKIHFHGVPLLVDSGLKNT